MFKEFAKLDVHHSLSPMEYYHPENASDVVTADSPALSVFTDFHGRPPVTIEKKTLATAALDKMKYAHVKALLVVDDDDQIIGLVSSSAILGVKKAQASQEHNIKQTEVTVWMIMCPIENLFLLNYKDLSNARVGHIARLLHDESLQHILVYNVCSNGGKMIRGIFSAARLTRQLGIAVGADLSSHTIAEMSKRI